MKKLMLILLTCSSMAMVLADEDDLVLSDDELGAVAVDEKISTGDDSAQEQSLFEAPKLSKDPTKGGKDSHYGPFVPTTKMADVFCAKFPAFFDNIAKLFNKKVAPKLQPKIEKMNEKRKTEGKNPIVLPTIKSLSDYGMMAESAATAVCSTVVTKFLPGDSAKTKSGAVVKVIYPLDFCAGVTFSKMAEGGGIGQVIGKILKKFYGASAMMMCATFLEKLDKQAGLFPDSKKSEAAKAISDFKAEVLEKMSEG